MIGASVRWRAQARRSQLIAWLPDGRAWAGRMLSALGDDARQVAPPNFEREESMAESKVEEFERRLRRLEAREREALTVIADDRGNACAVVGATVARVTL